jgi:type I restriction enzyme S subunit
VSLSAGKLQSIVIAKPNKNEQICIANYLDSRCTLIDGTIEKQKQVIEKLKEYKQSVITEAVTKGLNPNVQMKDSGIEWIGEIPKHWKVVRIKYLGTTRNGLTYKPEDSVDENQGTLVLRSSNIQNGRLHFADNVYVNVEISEGLVIRKGDILICSRNGSRSLIGKNALINDDLSATFGAFMMIFRCENYQYIHKILNSQVFNYYLGTFLTSTINQLTLGNFNNMEIVYCDDVVEQNIIVDYLNKKCDEIDNAIQAKDKIIEKLELYKKSLIYEYVTGKREVM